MKTFPKFREGKAFWSIIADEPTGQHDDDFSRSSYGGHLVAESIANPELRAFVIRACNSFQGLVAALRQLAKTDGSPGKFANAEVLAARVRAAAINALQAAGL